MSVDLSEKDFIIEFIKVYHSLNALWDENSKDFNDRIKKEAQTEILLKKYRERYPKATKKDVSRRINLLRSNFKRELKRLIESKKDLSSSNLWYFDAISFIDDNKTDAMWSSTTTKEDLQKKKSKKEIVPVDEPVVFPPKPPTKKKSNTFQKASEVWVIKLQDMDPNQALYAEKLINDVIFNGQLNKLNMDTRLVVENHGHCRQVECNQQYLKMENTFELGQSTFTSIPENPNPDYLHQSMPTLPGPYKPRVAVQNEKYFFEH